MKLLYMGSPEAAIAPLQWLWEQGCYTWLGVVSQPPKPQGRKQVWVDPPVARYAKLKGLPVWQPEKASSGEFLKVLRAIAPDIIITCAYGQILSSKFLATPTRATINIHPSLLPVYRGATPVHAALLDGCTTTGVSILFTVRALDAGHVILAKPFDIFPEESAHDLLTRLFQKAGPLLGEALLELQDPAFVGTPQDQALVTHCTKITKEDGLLERFHTATQAYRKFRAYQPWPGVYTVVQGRRLVLTKLSPYPMAMPPGELCYVAAQKALVMGFAQGALRLERLIPEGAKEMTAEAYWNGLRDRSHVCFSGEYPPTTTTPEVAPI